VRLRSPPGRGTTVTISPPRYLGEAISDGDGRKSPAAEAGKIILRVEDEPSLRMVIVEILVDLGYAVLEADAGQVGLKIVGSVSRIDLLLADVGLAGGMNGRQLADAARVHRPGRKVLFVIGYAASATLQVEVGMDVLIKPFGMDDLAGKIHQLIGKA
jgi:CheY-like chemotaxis protein